MLIAVGILCVIVGIGWWWLSRIGDTAYDQGRSLGILEGHLQYLGSRMGYSLDEEKGLETFMADYADGVAQERLPQSLEWNRTIFAHRPGSIPPSLLFRDAMKRQHAKNVKYEEGFALECEKWRKAGIAMWYILGSIQQENARDDVKALLFNLYEQHKKPVNGLTLEMGSRDYAAVARFRKRP